jgi:hypothetical protein
LKGYSDWFTDARLTSNGALDIEGTDAYMRLPSFQKTPILNAVLGLWRDRIGDREFKAHPVVTVDTPQGGDLWTVDEGTDRAKRLESWDTLRPTQAGLNPITGRFFSYLGFGMRAVDTNLTMNLNASVGTYLYGRVLDLSVNYGLGITSNTQDTTGNSTSLNMDIGGMMRIHFPLAPSFGLGGNVGGGLDTVISASGPAGATTSTVDVTGYGLVGLSKMVGRSTSFDVSMKLQKAPVLLFGITTFFGR